MAKVAFTEQAISDIEDIALFISNDSVHYAALQVQKFLSKVEILEQFPLTGRIVPEVRMKSIRELIEGNYRIIYKVVSKDLSHILTVHHVRRQLKRAIVVARKK